LFLLAFILILW